MLRSLYILVLVFILFAVFDSSDGSFSVTHHANFRGIGFILGRSIVHSSIAQDHGDECEEEETHREGEGVQWIITNKMRNILVKDLGYLDSEVNEMEPQIAAVVVERKLRRPLKGMPSSWKKTQPNLIVAKIHSAKNLLFNSKAFQFLCQRRKLLFTATIVAGSILTQRETIVRGLTRMCNRFYMKDSASETEFQGTSNRLSWKSIISNFGHSDNTRKDNAVTLTSPLVTPAANVDIIALDKLQSKSWVNSFRKT